MARTAAKAGGTTLSCLSLGAWISLCTWIAQVRNIAKRLRPYALDLIFNGLTQDGIVGCAFQCSDVGAEGVVPVPKFEADVPKLDVDGKRVRVKCQGGPAAAHRQPLGKKERGLRYESSPR